LYAVSFQIKKGLSIMQDSTQRKIIDFVAVLVVILSLPIIWFIAPRHKQGDVVVYNCGISEISPDFPLEVKEKCRKLNAEKIK
jgi:hypothetical protein